MSPGRSAIVARRYRFLAGRLDIERDFSLALRALHAIVEHSRDNMCRRPTCRSAGANADPMDRLHDDRRPARGPATLQGPTSPRLRTADRVARRTRLETI